jgi:signal transduction histidine kinase
MMLWFAWPIAAMAETKRVVLLHSFGRDFKPWSEYASSIRSELQRQSPWQLDIIDHSLVTARSRDEDPEVPFVAYLRALFASQPPDLIINIGAPAAAFVQRHRAQLFPSTPMLLMAVDERRVQFSALSENDAVVAVRIDYLGAMKNILQVLPDTRNVMVVVGISPIERFWMEEIRKEVEPLTNRVSFTWTNNLSFDELLKQAAALPPHSAIFWELMLVDAAGVVHEGRTALAKLHAVSSAPIFSYDESFFGREIVGGPLLTVLDSSRQTAAAAIRILGGEKASDVKIPSVKFSTPKFDWRELQRWGISERRLPPGSEIHFREPPVWERYRWQIGLVAVALLGQSLLIGGLFYQRRQRRLAEVEVRHRMAELAHVNRSATAGEMSASIAHEINQPLAAIVNSGSAGVRWLTKEVPDLEKAIACFNRITADGLRASQVLKTVRAMFKKDLQERDLLDVNEVLEEVLDFVRFEFDRYQVSVTRALTQGLPSVFGNRIELQQVVLNLVRNAVEAMSSNTVRARVLQVTSEASEAGGVKIGIKDSGPGIDPESADRIFEPFFTTKPMGMGMGLPICRSIVESHGGQLSAAAGSPYGAAFQIILPHEDKAPR